MLLIFGVTIWIPMLIAQSNKPGNWSEGLETFALAGAAWIVADYLATLGVLPVTTEARASRLTTY
jgi:hypothetical protein